MTPSRFTWILAVALLAGNSRGEDNWPQFRGINAQGHSDSRNLPASFAEGNIAWKTPIPGKSWSSPVVWGKQVWVTNATEDAKQLFAVCLDRESGKVIHNLKLFDVPTPQYIIPFNSPASPTPAIEDGRVYITFGSPGTACLDTATGKVLWMRTDFVCNHFRGAASSPVIFENLLLMHFDGSDFQYVVALDKATGRTVWKTNRSIDFKDLMPSGKPKLDGDLHKAFSTPVIAQVDGKPVMISLGSQALYAYDPRTGGEFGRLEYRNCHSGSPTPVLGDGIAYVCMGLSKGELWAIRLAGASIVSEANVLWKMKNNAPTRSSPLLVEGLLYVVDDAGMATCLEAKTGRPAWRQRLKGSNYSASPLYADGRIYFCSETGYITVIQPGEPFKQISESRLPDGFMASPAVAGSAMYLRTKTTAYRMEAK